jgi:glycosyltransferase involved in cell wall biosynthesis
VQGASRPSGAPTAGPGDGAAARLLLAGHSLSFCAPIARRARQRGAEVREDRWQGHDVHDAEASAAGLAWADVVLCEWCLGNAAWFTRHKRPGQWLVVRFHRMELDTPHPAEVDVERVDAMVFVARHVLEQACERYGWDGGDPRFQVIPNGIELDALRQPKLPAARFNLAAIGYVPRLKRLDRALDLLDLLRARDPRYRLLVKGRAPWEYEWMARRPAEREYFERVLRRVERSPNLRRAVSFEPFGEDVAAFLRQVGWILSTSEVEGHSVALAEGMASGAIPAILERPGADEQYEARWVHRDAAAAARAILAAQGTLNVHGHVETAQRLDFRTEGGAQPSFYPLQVGQSRMRDFGVEGEAASHFAERWSWERLWPAWERLLLGGERRGVAPAAAEAV